MWLLPRCRAANATLSCGECHAIVRRMPHDHAANAARPCGGSRKTLELHLGGTVQRMSKVGVSPIRLDLIYGTSL
ncbi:MAG: hypothetical protein ACOCN9_03620 [Prevotella sp.]